MKYLSSSSKAVGHGEILPFCSDMKLIDDLPLSSVSEWYTRSMFRMSVVIVYAMPDENRVYGR